MALSYTSILAGASGQSSGYSISNSARFVSGNSPELVFNPGVASTSQRKLTYSVWVKRVKLGVRTGIIRGGAQDGLRWDVGDTLSIFVEQGVSFGITTTALFRDTSAWYHIFAVIDTTNATTADRMQLWVNGVRQAVTGTCPTLNYDLTYFNKTGVNQGIGYNSVGVGTYADYYLSNFYGIDGQALTPSSFGQTNTSGVWVPKAYTGTYGTNGFFMEFKNSAALGTDTSGNGNTFTSSGLVAGDQMTDTPTLNYCTFNPLIKNNTTGSIVLTYSNGNLRAVGSAANGTLFLFGTMPFSSGKYRMEATVTNLVEAVGCGIVPVSKVNTDPDADHLANGIIQYFAYTLDGKVYNNNSNVKTNTASSLVDGELIAVEADITNGQLEWFHKDSGVWVSRGTYTFTPSGEYVFGVQINDNGCDVSVNFGQQGFDGTPTSGFGALNSANLPAPAIKDGSAHFQTTLYTGNGANNRAITQTGNSTFSPGLLWIKNRDISDSHFLVDVVRGASVKLNPNATVAEATSAGYFDSLDAAGFTVDSDTQVNGNTNRIVAWQWKAGGAGVNNTSGSITSTVSANPTAGFSIVTWTGTGANATVGHGLGVAPKMIIVKERSPGGDDWYVYHTSLISADYYVMLNRTTAQTSGSMWNNTAPTSSVFSLTSYTGANASGSTYVAYCFAPIAGFSAFGSYTGNGSADGPFIYTGFKPAWVMWKNASAAGPSWIIKDTSRDPYNVMTTRIYPDLALADDVNATNDLIDYVSNGFKIRSSANAQTNGSGNTLIYAAFASNPFGGAGVSPATAR